MGVEWALVALGLVVLAAGVAGYVAGRRGRGREADLEHQLLERRIVELERELATRKEQRAAGDEAAAEVVATERDVGAAAGVDDPRARHGLLLDDAPAGDRGPAGAPPGATA